MQEFCPFEDRKEDIFLHSQRTDVKGQISSKQPQASDLVSKRESDLAKDRNEAESVHLSSLIKSGIRAAWPICIGYIPLGAAFGILAQKAGFNVLDIAIMSIVVYAGSSQFIAVAMLGAGASPLSIVLTTFTVNLRHFLMSSALAVYLHEAGRKFLSLFSYGVTDESFAVNIVRFREGRWHPYEALTVNHAANFVWIISTILGGYGGAVHRRGKFWNRLCPKRHVSLLACLSASRTNIRIDGYNYRIPSHRHLHFAPRQLLCHHRIAVRSNYQFCAQELWSKQEMFWCLKLNMSF